MKKNFLLFLSFVLFSSCATQIERPKEERMGNKKTVHSFAQKKRVKAERQQKKPKPQVLSPLVKSYCHYFKTKVRPAVLKLSRARGKAESSYGLYKEIMELSFSDCQKLSSQEMASLFKPLRTLKEKKIALVLPLSGKDSRKGKFFLEGVEALLKEEGKNFKDYFSLFDTGSSFETAKKIYAQSFLMAKHSLVFGGTTKEEALFLKEVASSLRSPVLVFDRAIDNLEETSYFFQVLPQVSLQAEALAENCVLRGLQTVALFRPNHGYADSLLEKLVRELGRREIVVEKVLSYDSGDYHSMSAAVASLLPEEEEPLLEEDPSALPEEEEEDALVTILPGEASVLEEESPKVELAPFPIDGVFIPDDFRILKHFVKLFEFHKVPRVTLFGNEQWRSENLITLWEEYWNGAFFVDFMGSLGSLPFALTGGAYHSTLGHAGEILEIDAKRIAYYGAKMALQATEIYGVGYRKDLAQAMKAIKSEDIFEGLRSSSQKNKKGFFWPQYIFSLKNGEVEVSNAL